MRCARSGVKKFVRTSKPPGVVSERVDDFSRCCFEPTLGHGSKKAHSLAVLGQAVSVACSVYIPWGFCCLRAPMKNRKYAFRTYSPSQTSGVGQRRDPCHAAHHALHGWSTDAKTGMSQDAGSVAPRMGTDFGFFPVEARPCPGFASARHGCAGDGPSRLLDGTQREVFTAPP